MTGYGVDIAIRRAMGGDRAAISWIVAYADTTDDLLVIVMAALLEQQPERLRRAGAIAATTRDRQVVAIARAHLDGRGDLVDVLARDHLADFPADLIVAWIAADALDHPSGRDPSRVGR